MAVSDERGKNALIVIKIMTRSILKRQSTPPNTNTGTEDLNLIWRL